jgi:hypothetical protein
VRVLRTSKQPSGSIHVENQRCTAAANVSDQCLQGSVSWIIAVRWCECWVAVEWASSMLCQVIVQNPMPEAGRIYKHELTCSLHSHSCNCHELSQHLKQQ